VNDGPLLLAAELYEPDPGWPRNMKVPPYSTATIVRSRMPAVD
jgi:hypothetical protein